MRTSAIDLALGQILTKKRLGRYLEHTGGNLSEALSLYERNTRLSESFYSPLQCLEVCFRNKLDQALAARYGVEWMKDKSCPLNPDAKDEIERAIGKISKLGHAQGAVVADLGFGFWVGLIGPRYDATLWRNAAYKAFLPGGGKQRKLVHGRFNALRRFRNRVAHHEPIFHRDLELDHAEIMEAIGWMSREAMEWAAHQSRFPDVFGGASG